MNKMMRSNWLVLGILYFFIISSTLSLSSCGGGGGGGSTKSNTNTVATDVSGPTKQLSSKAAIISYLDMLGIYFENGSNPQGEKSLSLTDYGLDAIMAANQNGYTTNISSLWNLLTKSITINKTAQDFCYAVNSGYATNSANPLVKLFHPTTTDITPDSKISLLQVIVLYGLFSQVLNENVAASHSPKNMKSLSVSGAPTSLGFAFVTGLLGTVAVGIGTICEIPTAGTSTILVVGGVALLTESGVMIRVIMDSSMETAITGAKSPVNFQAEGSCTSRCNCIRWSIYRQDCDKLATSFRRNLSGVSDYSYRWYL